jgi:hypothetical protein
VSREDVRRGAGVGNERAAAQPAAPEIPLALTDEEKTVLETLVACKAARTVAQLCASSGLDRGQVTGTLESLRAKGLATRFNTLVESYAARFPGIEV